MPVTKNSIVTVDYQIFDTEGNLLHEEDEPIVYLHGDYGQIFKAIEEALEGKEVDDTFTVKLSSDKAFGEYDPELVVTEALSELPAEVTIGMEVDGYLDEDGEDVIIYTVTDIEGDRATLDGNHPLAGIDLVFEGKILDIESATAEEIEEILNSDD
ncbi:peptidylprolyl isomerase [Sulfuricurvum sp.]|uniref:FKBP-type peptidyl-prolyl cis-trans isomerase n=1 Tax=Sulfuricurvum sp. TaxID=2025608 RepID=UPI00260FBAE1|nr:peptidylprolyl isomerase [Sulfuricurvum sp.]MDD2267248.1 peptidylprolyl isomerase [Sulfuricurvum sp.]MDD2785222.1 peptidylprolyl isomerase [Sulfuricurvum sp.]